jgi:hypothetical protein
MSKVTFPLTGHSYSDDGSSDHDMLNGGHAENLLPMIGETIATAQSAIDAATSAAQSKQSTAADAQSSSQNAAAANTAKADAQQAATQAKNWAATVNVPVLTGKAGYALFANDAETGMVWRRSARSGGGANQNDSQVFFGQDRTVATRIRVTLNTSDLGLIVTDTDLAAVATTLQSAINTKADATATANALGTKANQSDLNNTNTAVATKASQDSLNVTNNTVAQKADSGWVVANFANRSLMDYGGVGSYTIYVQPQNIGDVVSLSGLSGSWRCMSAGTGGAGNDHLYCRIA